MGAIFAVFIMARGVVIPVENGWLANCFPVSVVLALMITFDTFEVTVSVESKEGVCAFGRFVSGNTTRPTQCVRYENVLTDRPMLLRNHPPLLRDSVNPAFVWCFFRQGLFLDTELTTSETT